MRGLLRADWEIGGDFQWAPLHTGPFNCWPRHARWFAMGRYALAALANFSSAKALWVPEYFCLDVLAAFGPSIRLKLYADDPTRSEPDWTTLKPRPRDMVLAVNYFGSRVGDGWKEWRSGSGTECFLVEDHTHDPFSRWATSSLADYAFASLRKTMPIPDGAILWSPRKLQLPPQLPESRAGGALEKLSGMVYKYDYLSSRSQPRLKEIYRGLLREAERRLQADATGTLSGYAAVYLGQGYPVTWRKRRSQNAETLSRELYDWPHARMLVNRWPLDAAPFGHVLVFEEHATQRRCRAYLEKHQVYCPVHWPQTRRSTRRARDLAAKSLTIPIDHRYERDDMAKIARILARFR